MTVEEFKVILDELEDNSAGDPAVIDLLTYFYKNTPPSEFIESISIDLLNDFYDTLMDSERIGTLNLGSEVALYRLIAEALIASPPKMTGMLLI